MCKSFLLHKVFLFENLEVKKKKLFCSFFFLYRCLIFKINVLLYYGILLPILGWEKNAHLQCIFGVQKSFETAGFDYGWFQDKFVKCARLEINLHLYLHSLCIYVIPKCIRQYFKGSSRKRRHSKPAFSYWKSCTTVAWMDQSHFSSVNFL